MTPPMACQFADNTGRALRPESRGDPRQRLGERAGHARSAGDGSHHLRALDGEQTRQSRGSARAVAGDSAGRSQRLFNRRQALGLPPSLVSHPSAGRSSLAASEGLSANAIAKALNERNVPTPTGSPWSAVKVVIRCGGGWRRRREYGGKGHS